MRLRLCVMFTFAGVIGSLSAQTEQAVFRAGASAVDITPSAYPVRVNGMFTERTAKEAIDPLHVRSIALDDGVTRIVLSVVDTCMMARDLIDQAKDVASRETGVSTENMMVSATHTHSAPSAMACLGSRMDPDYAAWLPGKVAEGIVAAMENLQPARVGWATVDDWAHTHNRRWIRRADKMFADPFGDVTVRAHMHPGYESADVIGPSGPVDPGLSVLALQTADGTPLALMANYSQHYFGSPLLSADYYGLFSRKIATLLGQSSSEGPFVAMMSQGTSGDLMWMDYGAPQKDPTLEGYSEAMAQKAMEAYNMIEWQDAVPLAMVEKKLTLNHRVPDERRLAWAKEQVAAQEGELPRDQASIYAHEALFLHEKKTAELKLQAIRIGDLSITTLPNEVYARTGLQLKTQSPFATHFNIELANGAEGYIPPPEQFTLGGYTTWPARTAGLEIDAEPKIVETLLSGLEEISGRSRKPLTASNGPYVEAILEAKPQVYWRLDEISGRTAYDASSPSFNGVLTGGAAHYLPGVGSGTGIGANEALHPSNFSGPTQINRAIHFADGMLEGEIPNSGNTKSFAFWFWLGERSGASNRSGTLLKLPSGFALRYRLSEAGTAKLLLDGNGNTIEGNTLLPMEEWHFVVLNHEAQETNVYIDAQSMPDISRDTPEMQNIFSVQFAEGLEGKLDEIAIFNRVLAPDEIASLWNLSGLAEQRAQVQADRERMAKEAAVRANPPVFPDTYAAAIDALRPTIHATLDAVPDTLDTEAGVRLSPSAYATFASGRLFATVPSLGVAYSVSLWFRNDTSNDARTVTAYLFSRGPNGNNQAPGDHLGIGGTHNEKHTGKLMLFNGNAAAGIIAGITTIPPGTWNHVVLIRDADRVIVYLNGIESPEIDGILASTTEGTQEMFLGARCDFFAPLKGYLAEFALFDRALSADEALQLHAASGQPTGTPKAAPRPRLALESMPLSPEEAIKSIHVPEGFSLDLVASEPLTRDPVAFDWDIRGRLWVVEMADYPLGMDGKGKPGGRVRVLEDSNGDGVYDESTLFADNINFPNGILTWRDGVIVTAAPDILFMRDTNGDDVADEQVVLLTGLSEGNQQLRANGLRWGLDNWVYVAAGGHHGEYALETKVRSSKTGEETAIGSRDFRFRPDTGEVYPVSGPTQFGRNRDDWGRWFGTQNSHPLWHYVLPDHYLKRNPHLAVPDGRVQVLGMTNPPVYPASAFQKRFHSFQHAGHYTSACSGMIYRDTRLFPEGDMSGFACEPFHNVVQRIIMKPNGVSFEGIASGSQDAPDFFASEDRWCRPVMVRTGPDGNLWIADMYRYMIEHPDWLPEEGKEELLPFYREGDDRGRIYRIRRTADAATAIPDLDALDAEGLVMQLASPNGWVRDKAQQLLLWRDDRGVVASLGTLFVESPNPLARLHALCTLDGLGALSEAQVLQALSDSHPGIRENALRLAESWVTPKVVAAVLRLLDDTEARVRIQLAFTLGALPASPEAGDTLAKLLLRDQDDPLSVIAALSSALPHQEQVIASLTASDAAVPEHLRRSLIEVALGAENLSAVAALLTPAFNEAVSSPASASMNDCVALLDLLERRKTSVADLQEAIAENAHRELEAAFSRLITFASATPTDDTLEPALRYACAALLLRVPEHRDGAIAFLLERIQPLLPPDELRDVLKALAATGDEAVPDKLLSEWPGLSPATREQALDQLLSRTTWTKRLVESLREGDIRPTDIDPTRRTRLLNHPDVQLRATVATLLHSTTSSARAAIIADFAAALRLKGDLAHGLALYKESCMPCHKHGDLGNEVGPDFRTVSLHPPEKILSNILDPNLDIQPGYHAYNCEMNDWEQIYGVIVSENAVSITLKIAGGATRNILRSDIATLQSTNKSLMPEGWEESFSHQDMADLIAFVKSQP